MSLTKKVTKHQEYTFPLLIALGFIVFLIVAGVDYFNGFIHLNASETYRLFIEDTFVKLGIISVVFYEFIPSVFRLIGTSGFYVGLLESGVSPLMLVLLTAVGKLGGQYILYVLGRFLFRVVKGKHRELAQANHIVHRYRVFIFLVVPFVGTLGDAIMVFAGHERIGFLKILPLLLIGDVLRVGIWLFFFIGQIGLNDIL